MDWFTRTLPLRPRAQQDHFPPSRFAALRRALMARPSAYAATRNHLDGAVTALSPYVTHGLLPADELFDLWRRRLGLSLEDKLLGELAWREFFHHVWHHRGEAILHDMRPGLAGVRYADRLPEDLRQGATGVPVIDATVRRLYQCGWLHNHQRMWLASYVVHLRKVHWRVGADWMYGHLLDGDLASNHLSWQWVAGTFSRKPYLFNADNVERYAPGLSCRGTAIDRTYAELERIACAGSDVGPEDGPVCPVEEPPLYDKPPGMAVREDSPEEQERWTALIHPWSLEGRVPQLRQIGILHAPFHRRFPWSARRWAFVLGRMHDICDAVFMGELTDIAGTLAPRERLLAVMTLNPGYREGLALAVEGCLAPPPTALPELEKCMPSYSAWLKVQRRRNPALWAVRSA
ncbi:MAG: FAD-binding domain-containing protein [Thiobacillaceae bacterium]